MRNDIKESAEEVKESEEEVKELAEEVKELAEEFGNKTLGEGNETDIFGTDFFKDVRKYDDGGFESVGGISGKGENEIIGKGTNRKFDKKWNIKICMGTEFFDGLFRYLREMGYSTVFKFNEKEVRIYVIDPSKTHAGIVAIDKTEMAEYELKGLGLGPESALGVDGKAKDIIVYVDTDVIEDMGLNAKYPVDLFFDIIGAGGEKSEKKMYIVNGKELVSRKVNSMENKDGTLGMYEEYEKRMFTWIKDENCFRMSVSSNGLKGALVSLEKKKKAEIKLVSTMFKKNEIEFVAENEVRRHSSLIYGEDIVVGGSRDVENIYNLENLVKFGKLKLTNYVSLYIKENSPLVFETKLGSGKIVLYYLIAPNVSV